jgi:transcription initiation factor IIE alpha subunit
MSVTQTSRDAYDSVDLTDRQIEVAQAGEQLGTFTDVDLANHLGWTINRITPRRGELVDAGIFIKCGERLGPTNRRCSVWKLKPRQMSLFEKAA